MIYHPLEALDKMCGSLDRKQIRCIVITYQMRNYNSDKKSFYLTVKKRHPTLRLRFQNEHTDESLLGGKPRIENDVATYM